MTGGLLSTSLASNTFPNTRILRQKMLHLRPLERAKLPRWKQRLPLMRPAKLPLRRKSNCLQSDKRVRLVLHMKPWKIGSSAPPRHPLLGVLVVVVGKDVDRAVAVEEDGGELVRLLARPRKLLLLPLKRHPFPVVEAEVAVLAEEMLEGVEAEVKVGPPPRLSRRLDRHHPRLSPLRLLRVPHLSLLLLTWRPSSRDRMDSLR